MAASGEGGRKSAPPDAARGGATQERGERKPQAPAERRGPPAGERRGEAVGQGGPAQQGQASQTSFGGRSGRGDEAGGRAGAPNRQLGQGGRPPHGDDASGRGGGARQAHNAGPGPSGRRGDGNRGGAPQFGPRRDGGAPARRPAPLVALRRRSGRPLYAALDLGTNNCRLLIAEPNAHGFRVVDAFSRIVRLGEGLSQSGRLSEAAQARAIEALKICHDKLAGWGVERMKLVATEACRSATNGEAFLARVASEAGLMLEIVSRESEARLAVAGCANLIDWRDDGAIVFDIGGGSSELVWLDLDRNGRHHDLGRNIRAWTSLPVGVVTLSERHGGVHVNRDVFEDMVNEVAEMVDAFAAGSALSEAVARGRMHLIGTSGTVTTLAGIYLNLARYDRRRVDGTWLEDRDVDDLMDHLLTMSFEQRVAHPCIGADRADLVLAGCAILEAIRRRWPCERLRVADRGLREGILTELMTADGLWGDEPGAGRDRERAEP
jgi:exopolyphosphatase/guanosine-5'-triphosphate,3'-diphosphate pyrophosphatase